jgi:hypothetical protein
VFCCWLNRGSTPTLYLLALFRSCHSDPAPAGEESLIISSTIRQAEIQRCLASLNMTSDPHAALSPDGFPAVRRRNEVSARKQPPFQIMAREFALLLKE